MAISPFRNLEEDLEAASEHGTVSLWWGDLIGARFARNADVPHYAASTMKLPLVIAVLRKAARGEIVLAAPVEVHNSFTSVADGSTFSVDPAEDDDPGTWSAAEHGTTRSVLQLCDHAITHSGNLAANILLEMVGLDEIAHVLHAAGCSDQTVIRRGIEDARAREAGITNTVTAADLGRLMASLARHDTALGGALVCAPVEAMLSRSRHRNQIPAGLPSGVTTANKTGWVDGVSHDVCLVRPLDQAPFVLSICTTTHLSETAAAGLVASLAKDVWRIFTE
ncbi:serine hydrolase [Intrasporangium chromatireducens]|uniref:serine hydrolase n=1 Tax=Intrasporangium chromatireducens TaxID=1386088 RepID=UPI0004B525CA|nr:serine hydrolase [Intrasporangium chromatireducens]